MPFFVFVLREKLHHFCNVINMYYFNRIFMRSVNIKKRTNSHRELPLLIAIGLFLFSQALQAQGWEFYYGGNNEDVANKVLQTRDEGFITVGHTNSAPASGFDIYLLRTDVDGTILWEQTIGSALAFEFGYGITEAHDGGFVVVGETLGGGMFGQRDVYMAKVDSLGNFEWETSFGTVEDDRGLSVIATADGGYAITGSRTILDNRDVYIIKTDVDGNLDWEVGFGSVENDEGRVLLETPDGDFIIAGATGENENSNVYVVKIDGTDQSIAWAENYGGSSNDIAYDMIRTSDGQYLIAGRTNSVNSDFYVVRLTDQGTSAQVTLLESFGGALPEVAFGITEAADGNYVLTGTIEVSALDIQATLVKIDTDGDIIWDVQYGREFADFGSSIITRKDGGFLVAGNSATDLLASPDLMLIKTDAEGVVLTNYITGEVFYDLVNDCQLDGDEEGIHDWVVVAKGNEKTFYGATDAAGNYSIRVEPGQYEVTVARANDYWQSCVESYLVDFPASYDTLVRNFAIWPDIDCTDLEVDVSATFIEACAEAEYQVDFCNHGTTLATGVEVEVVVAANLEYLSVVGASLVELNDSLYTFSVTDLAVGQCEDFTIRFNTDCDAPQGAVHGLKARITPDDICLPDDPAWSGASVAVNGYCDGDSVHFELQNVGIQSMLEGVNYIVVEDILMGLQEPDGPVLESGEITRVSFPANGSTYRLVAEQVEGHPGDSRPTVAVEGCEVGGGPYTTGIHTQLPEDDYDHFLSTDFQESILIDSNPTQLKRGYPKGYGDEAEIAADTDLKYHIKFQNTGIDTAIRVVIRDTLSPFLDPQTVRLGASSHDFEFEVYGEGILKFTFNNIMLVDSSADESQSHGFIKYRISQRPDNSIGSVIKNVAAVYFDYDEPENTGNVCHKVAGMDWSEFIIVSDQEVFLPGLDIRVYPNPFTDLTTFEIEGLPVENLYFNIFDLSGRLIRREAVNSQYFQLHRDGLSSGMYIYKFEAEHVIWGTGKIIVD